MKKKAAIYCLSSRKEFLEKALMNFYENWNYKYEYPVFIHYWGKIYDDERYIENIKNKISKNINFVKIKVEVPSYLKEEELFYSRDYNPYVKKKFSKRNY